MNDQMRDKLKNLGFFKSFSEETLYRLSLISKEAAFRCGEVIIEEGNEENALYFMVSGEVSLQKRLGGDGGEFSSVGIMGRGDIFGAIETDPHRRSFIRAQAISDGELIVLKSDELRTLIMDDSCTSSLFFPHLVEAISRRLLETTQELSALSEMSLLIASGKDVTDLLEGACSIVGRSIPSVDGWLVALYNPYSDDYEVACHHGVTFEDRVISAQDPLVKHLRAHGGYFEGNPGKETETWGARFTGISRAFMTFMGAGTENLAFMAMLSRLEEPPFTGAQKNLLLSLARQLAAALEHAAVCREDCNRERLSRHQFQP
ncbi:MAG: cyclic nucleotide-binding domain-containing protein [Candidatus Eremiobacteraeota bacterium]|nr:cyclic nucleotide-binding domain-containing protein [Candidatus Eremiobacteraeota bacterium]